MMASWLKGLIVGVSTACASAILLAGYIAIHDRVPNPLPLIVAIAVIGAIPGLAIGAIAGAIAGRLAVARRTVLIAIGAFGTAALGVLTLPELIPIGVVAPVAGALVLERWTRENLAAPRPPRQPMAPVLVGMMVALANAAVVAIVLALVMQFRRAGYHEHCSHHHGFETAIALFVVGGVVAMPIGAVAGAIAGALGGASTSVRRLLLGALAGACILLGPAARIPLDIMLPALPSTLIAALVLERLTRRAPPLPPARALV